jgi:hypothetical protein
MYPNIRNLRRSLFQQIIMSDVSDASWDLSPPTQREIFNIVNIDKVTNDTLPVNLVFTYAFNRPLPADQQFIEKELPIINIFDLENVYEDWGRTAQEALKKGLNPTRKCDPTEIIGKSLPPITVIEFTIPKWFIPTVRLPGNTKPKLIRVDELSTSKYYILVLVLG